MLPAAIFFSAVFIVIPAFAGKGFSHWIHGSFPVAEGIVRLALFIAYLVVVGQLKEIRRVFQYHGAEHKAIAAYENDVELTPEAAQQFSTAHVRCGTNFLLTVMVVAVFVYSFIPRPNLLVRHRVAHRADAGDRGAELRGDPLRGEEHAARAGCAC